MELHTWQDWVGFVSCCLLIWFLLGCAVVQVLAWTGKRRDEGDQVAAAGFTLDDAEKIADYVDPEVVDDEPEPSLRDMIEFERAYRQQRSDEAAIAEWEAQR